MGIEIPKTSWKSGGGPDYPRVKREVAALLRKHAIDAPPVPIREIVEAEGVDVRFVRFATLNREVAGFTRFDEAAIYVNADDALNRQTWTIAHEFGHWTLHRDRFEDDPERYNILLRRPVGLNSDPLEKEANAFARMLLIPEQLLRRVKGRASTAELARMFLVSPEAMEQALTYV